MDGSLILQTLIYAGIFHFPLNEDELWRYLIADKFYSKRALKKALTQVSSVVSYQQGYYMLKGSESIVKKRLQREKISQEKYYKAKKVARLLSAIPTISFIGLSGGVAIHNASENDDIDFFIITYPRALWISRFLLLIVLEFLGKRRKKLGKHTSNKICVNMLVTQDSMQLPKKRHDLFTAHEITQMVPLFERSDVYKRFFEKNRWTQVYLPNARAFSTPFFKKPHKNSILLHGALLLEPIAKKIQYWYMKKGITNETISDTLLAFHPFDYRTYSLNKYQSIVRKLHSKSYKIEFEAGHTRGY